MKKLVLAALLLALCLPAFAEEQKMALGIGLEWNMNARENFAGGAALSFDYSFLGSFAAGVNVTASSGFSGNAVIEPAALFRWHFFGGFFAQADLGAYLVLEDNDVTPLFLGGLRAGFRMPLGSLFYVEPYGRTGYPFMFGLGVMGGILF
jgi:hypothetical protein